MGPFFPLPVTESSVFTSCVWTKLLPCDENECWEIGMGRARGDWLILGAARAGFVGRSKVAAVCSCFVAIVLSLLEDDGASPEAVQLLGFAFDFAELREELRFSRASASGGVFSLSLVIFAMPLLSGS